MVGCNRNIRVQDWIYQYFTDASIHARLHIEAGPKTVNQIVRYLNQHRLNAKGDKPRGRTDSTHHQVAQVMRGSKLFKKVGTTLHTNAPVNGKLTGGIVALWDFVPVEKVVDDLIERGQRIRPYQPKVIKAEFERRGLEIESYQ